MSVAANDPEGKARFAAFEQGLQQFGWVDGRKVRIEIRWSGGKSDNARKYAAELIALKPDVILASGGAIVGPLLQVTRTIPSPRPLIRWRRGSSPAWRGRAATPRDLPKVEYGMAAKWLELSKSNRNSFGGMLGLLGWRRKRKASTERPPRGGLFVLRRLFRYVRLWPIADMR